MKLLHTINRQKGIDYEGKTFLREAVRGIALRDEKLLMIYSSINGDYKFLGGGIEAGESHLEALQREISEESGATLSRVTGELGKIIEYGKSFNESFDTYKQISYYYFCEVEGEIGSLDLDEYEEALGFQPVWVDIETALETNKNILAEAGPSPRWTRREVFVLELLTKHHLNLPD